MKLFYKIFILIGLIPIQVKAQTSGSVTQGLGTTITANLMPNCASNHLTPLGTITSTDKKVWTVPADNNFQSGNFCPDLHNSCNSVTPSNLSAVNLKSIAAKTIDQGGDTITGYIFTDNYFEFYVNGTLIGVDPVPFTPFNSCVVRFVVKKPYTMAFKFVDWEENLGLGSEIQSPSELYHPGDGGFIAQFSDGKVTDASWKTQCFYIAPIQDLNTVKEMSDGTHSTATASNAPTCNANCYGIHYDIPVNWTSTSFDDSGWPKPTIYTAAQVTNAPAYTNFASTAWNKASFIWTSNLILDNVVLARKTVQASNSILGLKKQIGFKISNPFSNQITILSPITLQNTTVNLFDMHGQLINTQSIENLAANAATPIYLNQILNPGIYILKIENAISTYQTKLIYQAP